MERTQTDGFTPAQTRTWQKLYQLLEPRVLRHGCREYVEGFRLLELPRDEIPTLEDLNRKIEPATGWSTVRTSTRYSDAVDWYRQFARRRFLVTDYIREEHELEFTPEPDMFHDIFGHLPFLMIPRYAEFEDLFAPAFLRADDQRREQIKRLAWYTAEFGMVREDGELKVFGAGLLSSAGEIDRVMAGETPLEEFSIAKVVEVPKSVWEYNSVLFVADGLDHFHRELAEWFDRI
ncbi:MAG: amino acid hydroxylase [Candidatus Krumholzibacteriia bacterium]